MAFGKRKNQQRPREMMTVSDLQAKATASASETPELTLGSGAGPYDFDSMAPVDDLDEQRLNIGSLYLPLPEGSQLQLEMGPQGELAAVHILTPVGRITSHAYASRKSGGGWREAVPEIVEAMKSDGGQAQIEDGRFGREVAAVNGDVALRFIGVDGPRWMVRTIVAGPIEIADQSTQLAYNILAETVVKRGKEPLPYREQLPLALPDELVTQLAQAQEQHTGAGQDFSDSHLTGQGDMHPGQSGEVTSTDVAAEAAQHPEASLGSAMHQLRNQQ